ncbi:MAG: hypothetical protein ACI9QD_000150 [Thermoproteota archaeon]|jgi:hypothetical protein
MRTNLTKQIRKFIFIPIFTFIFVLGSVSLTSSKVYAQAAAAKDKKGMSPKLRAFLVLSGYGTTGGGLLGLASMAFGEDSIAIARGMSLGLYAGMLFGSYVILSHRYAKKGGQELPSDQYSEDSFSPYGEEGAEEDGGYDSFFSTPQRMMEYEERNLQFNKIRSPFGSSPFTKHKGGLKSPPIFVPLMHIKF